MQAEPGAPLEATSPEKLGTLQLQLVTQRHDSHLHNKYIERYHYLGYQPLPGAQLRYFVKAEGCIIALLGFGAAAWKTQPRDLFIGWTPQQRKARLHRVVNNARFLILPWVRCKNLASTVLAMTTRSLAQEDPRPTPRASPADTTARVEAPPGGARRRSCCPRGGPGRRR